jgi:hypothetical protein
MASWKEGFSEDTDSYQNHDPTSKEEEHEKWKENFYQLIKDNPQYLNQPFTVPKFHICADTEQQTTTQPLPPLSSVGSMVAKYPMDSIIEDTPCWLHVPIGRKGRIVNVAEGIAMVSHTLHHAPIPSDCVKVQVLKVVEDQYLDTKLDYPNEDEGIEKL